MPLNAPNSEVFYSRNHPKDPRIGELMPLDGKGPKFALVGWPDDRGVRLNKGRTGAAEGPHGIRQAFYKLTPGVDGILRHANLKDLGNLVLEESLEASHTEASNIIEELRRSKTVPLVLGGGNDYAYADVLGVGMASKFSKRIGVINIDAHYDVRDLQDGPSSGTPYFRMLQNEPKLVSGEDFYEFATQPHRNAEAYHSYLMEMGANVLDLNQIQDKGTIPSFRTCLETLRDHCDEVVVSLDIDSVRQSDAPGCSAPSPNGLSAKDVEAIAKITGAESKVCLFSIYEVAPKYDLDNLTSKLAASTLWYFLEARLRNV